MSDVRLIPLGVGEAFTALNYTTCLALGVDDVWILIECPHPVRKLLREGSHAAGYPLDLDRISAVLISHLHADHCSGLEDYGYYSYFALGRRGRVVAHPSVSAHLWDGLLSAGMGEGPARPGRASRCRPFKQLDDFFDRSSTSTTRAPATLGPFSNRVPARRSTPIPTFAFRIPRPVAAPAPRLQRPILGVRPHPGRLALSPADLIHSTRPAPLRKSTRRSTPLMSSSPPSPPRLHAKVAPEPLPRRLRPRRRASSSPCAGDGVILV